jgi:hypothetical protein
MYKEENIVSDIKLTINTCISFTRKLQV